MKILISTFTYWPASNGVANCAVRQSLALSRAGHDVTVVSYGKGEDTQLENVRIRHFDVSGSRRLLEGISGSEGYRQFLLNEQYDIIIIHCWQAWPLDSIIDILPQISAKKVLISHGISVRNYFDLKSFITRFRWSQYEKVLIPQIFKHIDHIVFLEEHQDKDRFLDKFLRDKYYQTLPYSVIPNGGEAFDTVGKTMFREKYSIKDEEVMVLLVGSYSRIKNEKEAVRIFSKLQQKNVKLVLIGGHDNSYRAELQQQIAQLPTAISTRILSLTGLTREEIASAYKGADIYLNVSQTESQPLVILDAIANRVPFVSNQRGAISSIPGGVVVKRNRDIAGALDALAQDPERRKQLGIAGRRGYEEKYNWDLYASKYVALVNKITNLK
jgi:glycosyltransferase involved in cell wall biosynthesis